MLGYSPAPPPSPSVGCAIYCLLAYPANWAFLKFVVMPGSFYERMPHADAVAFSTFLLVISPISLPAELMIGGAGWVIHFIASLGRILF